MRWFLCARPAIYPYTTLLPPFHPSPFSLILLSLQSMIQGACDHEKRQRIGWDIDGTCPVCMRTYILPGTAITSIRKIYEISMFFYLILLPCGACLSFWGFTRGSWRRLHHNLGVDADNVWASCVAWHECLVMRTGG